MLMNFRIAVEAVMPIFLLILLGMASRNLHIMSDTELNHANKAIFQVMFPIMMFYNIYSVNFSGVILPGYIAFCIGMLLVVYGLALVVALLTEKQNYSRGALIQAVYRGNFVLMGIPIMNNLMGDEAMGLTTVMVAIIVPIYNVLAVITLGSVPWRNLKARDDCEENRDQSPDFRSGGRNYRGCAGSETSCDFVKAYGTGRFLRIRRCIDGHGRILPVQQYQKEPEESDLRGNRKADCQSGAGIRNRISVRASGTSVSASHYYVRSPLCGIGIYHGAADGQQRGTGCRMPDLYIPFILHYYMRMDFPV